MESNASNTHTHIHPAPLIPMSLTPPPAVSRVDLADVQAPLQGGALHLALAAVGVAVAAAQGLGIGWTGLRGGEGHGLTGAGLHATRRGQAVLRVLARV